MQGCARHCCVDCIALHCQSTDEHPGQSYEGRGNVPFQDVFSLFRDPLVPLQRHYNLESQAELDPRAIQKY